MTPSSRGRPARPLSARELATLAAMEHALDGVPRLGRDHRRWLRRAAVTLVRALVLAGALLVVAVVAGPSGLVLGGILLGTVVVASVVRDLAQASSG